MKYWWIIHTQCKVIAHNNSSVVPVASELLCLKDVEMSLLLELVYHINLEFREMKPNAASSSLQQGLTYLLSSLKTASPLLIINW